MPFGRWEQHSASLLHVEINLMHLEVLAAERRGGKRAFLPCLRSLSTKFFSSKPWPSGAGVRGPAPSSGSLLFCGCMILFSNFRRQTETSLGVKTKGFEVLRIKQGGGALKEGKKPGAVSSRSATVKPLSLPSRPHPNESRGAPPAGGPGGSRL